MVWKCDHRPTHTPASWHGDGDHARGNDAAECAHWRSISENRGVLP
jgi:hypothetical protein